jgi:hypothetical protein
MPDGQPLDESIHYGACDNVCVGTTLAYKEFVAVFRYLSKYQSISQN